jgi:hypothetical protein
MRIADLWANLLRVLRRYRDGEPQPRRRPDTCQVGRTTATTFPKMVASSAGIG